MKIVILHSCVMATHADAQDLTGLYPGCLILTVPDGTPVEIGQTWEVDLDAAKTSACATIDALAEKLRATVLTPGGGQAAEYQRTREEAVALQADKDWQALYAEALTAVAADGELAVTDYPGLVARQASLGTNAGAMSLAQVARAVLADAAAAYPFLAAEQAAIAATTGEVTLVQVARAVLSDMAAADTALAAIKRARRAAKLRIHAANDPEGVLAARDGASWPQTDATTS